MKHGGVRARWQRQKGYGEKPDEAGPAIGDLDGRILRFR